MNFISWNAAISLFPQTTFVRRKWLRCAYPNDSESVNAEWLEKDKTITVAPLRSPLLAESTTGLRYVGDQFSWKISVDCSSEWNPIL